MERDLKVHPDKNNIEDLAGKSPYLVFCHLTGLEKSQRQDRNTG